MKWNYETSDLQIGRLVVVASLPGCFFFFFSDSVSHFQCFPSHVVHVGERFVSAERTDSFTDDLKPTEVGTISHSTENPHCQCSHACVCVCVCVLTLEAWMIVNTFMRHLFRWRDHAKISLQPFILDRNDSGSSVYFCPCWSFFLDGGAIEKSVCSES